MRIKFLVSMAGPEVSYGAGDEAEFEDAEAIRLIDAEIAAPVRGKKIETQTVKPTETAN